MSSVDTRSPSDDALEVLRFRAVAMHEAGNTQVAVAMALGVHQNTASRWLQTDYPEIKKRARKEGAEIHGAGRDLGAEPSQRRPELRSQRSAPGVQRTARRYTASMISSTTNRGTARLMI